MKKFVMKNTKTNQYYCTEQFPPLCNDLWKADRFETSSEAKGHLGSFLPDTYNPKDFAPVLIELIEHES